VAWAADSAGNRGDSIIMLGMAPVGIHLATLVAPPVRVAVLLGDLTVGFDSGSADNTQSSGTAKSTATYTNQGLNVRYFFGNSFNASFGYHMRNYSAEATSTSSSSTYSGGSWTTTTASETFTLDAKTTVATLGIGNHWLMDWGLWIGVDWLLASNALSQTSEATLTSSTGTVTAAESAQFKKDAEKLGDLINAVSASSGFAVLTIGLAF
tara:strand:+ start:53 stop:682 length:630 start_codon:yes stop_codon:yes gene_type:complete